MSDDELRDALDRAADVVPDRDLSQTAWYAGRSRKRRTSRGWWGAGAAAAAAAVIGAVAWGGGLPQLADSQPAATSTDDTEHTSTGQRDPDAVGQGKRGQPTVLAFTSEAKVFEHSGVLQPWTEDSAAGATWRLLDPRFAGTDVDPGFGGPSAREPARDDLGVALTLDGGTWSLRGCGLAMQAEGSVTDGRVAVTGDWDVEPDPDPGASCVVHDWLDPDLWQDFLDGAPLAGRDGRTLLLSGSLGEHPALDRVSVGFARAGVADPQVGPGRAATWDDLAEGWAEAPLDDLTAQLPGHVFADTEADPEADPAADVHVTSPRVGDLSITGCDETGFAEAWLLDTGAAAVFLDPVTFFTAQLCVGPGARQQSLVTSLLMSEAVLTVYGDYLVIDGWLSPEALDPQPLVEEARPDLLMPATQLPDLERISQAESLLPEVLAVPADGIRTLSEDPTDRFVVAIMPEDPDNPLLVLGPDQRWRTATTDVGTLTPTPHLAIGGSQPLLDTSISPTGAWLAYRTDASVVMLSAPSGEAREFETGGKFANDFVWLDDDRLAVDLRDDDAMVIDAANGQVSRDTTWGQVRSLAPWQIVVQIPGDELTGPVALQQLDSTGDVVEETQLGFNADVGFWSAPAEDRVATVVTTEDPTVIEPGSDGIPPESVSLVLAYDGTQSHLNVLQADRDLDVVPIRWVDRGTLIVSVFGDGFVHYLLWDSQNGDTQLLTRVDLPLVGAPAFGRIVP